MLLIKLSQIDHQSILCREFSQICIINQMLSKALQSILRRYFGQFITGLQNVELTFWTGKINIQNASFKHQKINELLKTHNIPLTIKFSFLGNLQIDVPWNKLTSAPVEIKVSNVMIVLKLQKVMNSKADVQNLREHAKLMLIKNYLDYLIKKSEEIKTEQSVQSGFLQKLFTKILHNLNLEVNNIHIRIENNNNTIIQSDNPDDQFVDCKSESEIENLGFSLGFCLQSIEAQTINANNIKQFVKIQNDKTEVRKKINLKQINLYWQENTSVNLFQYPQDKKIQFLRTIINRKQHRLLTIDGQILMERSKNNFDYFFSSSFRLLEIGLNYEQLKQFIEVYQQFINAKTKKKITKMKEIEYTQQLKLQTQFKNVFKKLHNCNFKDVKKDEIQLLQAIDKKLLMKWTKEQIIELLKKIKLKQAYQNKNKKTWIGFLSKNVQNQLSQEQISTIQQEINKFINMIEQQSFAKSIGFYLHFSLLRLIMDHHRVQQQLLFSAENIELHFQGNKSDKKASLEIADVSLIYFDLINRAQVNIFKNYRSQNQQKYFSLRVEDNKKLQKVDINIASMKIIHQIQFLSFLAELVKLRQRQKIKSQVAIISPELRTKNQQISSIDQKIYQCNITMKKLQVIIELSSTSSLNAYIESIIVEKQVEINSHRAKIVNLGIIFLQKDDQINKDYNILDDLNIEITLKKVFKVVQSSIPLFSITLNQQSLYYIVHCMKDQYAILKIRSVQRSNQIIGEEKVMEGQTSIISVFKAVNIYHSVLTSQYLYFYQKDNQTIKYENLAKKLQLKNIKVSKIDNHSFKLESVLVNEIVTCKDQIQTDRWIYHIQQRIFDNSTKMQIFNMMDENQDDQSPAIYIHYDSLIQIQVNRLEIIYEKNCQDKIMSVDLRKLKISLKENNLQFQRKVDLDQLKLVDLTLTQQNRQEYNLILSNTYNYFQDLDQEEQSKSNIEILIEGKKKTHPKYTGELTIKSRVNKLFINYNAEFVYSILYRLLIGETKVAYFNEETKYLKIIQYVKEILQTKNNIDEQYASAKEFQFDKSYVQLQKYKQIYSCLVLFHVQIRLQELQVNLVNGRTFHWLSKLTADSLSFQIDKSTDFMFIKGSATTVNITDLTGYPNTSQLPFTQLQQYPIIKPYKNRRSKQMIELSVGVYEPMTFINSQRFKNYFLMNLNDVEINYQQQPLLRFVDFLTNQIILFILQPFSLHKFDSPYRGPFEFSSMNFTQEQIKKMIYQSMYPTFTHLNINGSNLLINFNSHPNDQLIPIFIDKVTFKSVPYLNSQKIHVRLDEFKRFKAKYRLLQEIAQGNLPFDQKINKCQWVTRYLITAQGCRSQIMDNDFNYDMYFQRTNNGDKDLLLPFLAIEKDLLMQGQIKHLTINASKKVYNLINKCFLFNLSYDDRSDGLFNTNHQFQSLSKPNKLIYRLMVNQFKILIPQISKTVIIIHNCQYKFLKLQDTTKQMEVNGKNLYIVNPDQNLITPINIDQQKHRGLEYTIIMKPSGQKKMTSFIRQIDLHYHQQLILTLFKYFLLDQSCYPKQDIYTDIPLIICEVYLLNSYIKLVQNDEHVYALKGDIKVVWNRYQQPHPETYRQHLQYYPKDKDGSSYDIEFKGVTFRKYNKKTYTDLSSIKQASNYRSLSSSMRFKVNLTNVMKISNQIKYSDMVGFYQIKALTLKLSYQDFQEITSYFKKGQPQVPPPPPPALPYTPYSKHKIQIRKCSFQFGLSQLPVPLIDINLENSQIDIQLIGKTNVMTTKMQFNLNYWNMMIGRWQPLVERSSSQITVKAGQYEKYLMATSSKPLLLNFSVQSLKILKLISKDISQKGNMHIINKDDRVKGVQISPYIITNRTGYNIIIHSDFILTDKLKNNQKMHLQNRNLQLDQTFSTLQYQIQGDGSLYGLNLNLNQIQKPVIMFNQRKYRLIISAFATPVLKEIIISSEYVIHNTTIYPLILTVGQKQYEVDSNAKVSIPFTEEIPMSKNIRLQFLHLKNVTQNFNFEFRDIARGYEHYIIYQDCRTFNCLISLQSSNENVITISPLIAFINLLPLDVNMQIALTKLNKDKIILRNQLFVNQQQLFYEFGSKDDVALRIHIKGFNISQFTHINLSNQKDKKEINNQIQFVDLRGIQSFVRNKIIKKQKRKYIYIYSDSVLINQTHYKFYVFNQYELLAGQRLKGISQSESKYVFLNNVQNPSLCFSQQDAYQSKKIITQNLKDQIVLINNHTLLHQLVINNSVNCLCQQVQIFTSITKVAPRFLLVNKCRRDLAFQQFNTDQKFFLRVGERKDWYWHHSEEARLITITAIDNQIDFSNGWGFSAPFSLEKIEETVLVIRPKNKSADRLLVKTQIIKQNQQIFIIFKELIEKQDSLIKIQNNLKLVNLQVHQQYLDNLNPPWIQYKHFICGPLKQVDFGWDYPQQDHKLLASFQFIGPYRSRFNNETITLNLQKMQKPQFIDFKAENDDQILTIEVSIEIVGLRRTLIFQNRDESQASNYNDDDLVAEMYGNKMGVSLCEIGISIIGGKEHRSQMLYMSIKKVDLIMTEKQMKRNYELKIKYINIDNNLNHNTMYPVLFTPLQYRKTFTKSRPFFICLIQQNLKTKQIKEINYFRLCIQPISFKIHDEMLTKLYDFQQSFNAEEKQKIDIDLNALFQCKERQYQWQKCSITKQGSSIFIRQIQIGKVIVELSFSLRPNFSGNIIIYTIFALFKTALSNISESQMRLSRFLCNNLSLGDVMNQLGQFYKNQVFKQIYKIAGSINLLGNPYVFVKYLAQGAWQIVNQPSQGFIKGPIEGAVGIGRGGVYFVRNVVAGTFNSFEVISQSCSRGLAYITFDDKFISRRQKIQMQKSRHLIQGSKSAIWALYTGFQVAITGIVRHPREEKKKIGTAGIFKGLAIGLAGLVTKPMSGLFQAISKFSQGIKQTALFFQDGPNSTRSRPPRVFISNQQYYSDYNVQESKAINLLQFHSTKHLQKTILLVAVDENIDNDCIYTVVTSEYLVQLSKKNKKIIKEVKLVDISEVQLQQVQNKKGVRIKYNHEQMLILTQKYKQLYQCFKEIFSKIQDQYEDQEYYQQ